MMKLFVFLIVLSIVHAYLPPIIPLTPDDITFIKYFCGNEILPTPENPNPNSNIFKIKDGIRAQLFQFPWSAIVRVKRTQYIDIALPNTRTIPVKQKLRCSGTVISQRHVITAASCIFDRNIFRDKAGKTEYDRPMEMVEPSKITVKLGGTQEAQMTSFQVRTYTTLAQEGDDSNNYVFLELDRAISFGEMSSGMIRPICMTHEPCDPHREDFQPDDYTIVGFAGGLLQYRRSLFRNEFCENVIRGENNGLATCYSVLATKDYVVRDGDEGSAIIRYDLGGRAYLEAVYISVVPRPSTDEAERMRAIGVAMFEQHANAPLRYAAQALQLTYTVMD